MIAKEPEIKKDAMYQLLRDGKIKEFNHYKNKGKTCDLTHCDFRTIDLQGLDASSIHDAKISGAYFPNKFSSDEITMSLIRGTRLRSGM